MSQRISRVADRKDRYISAMDAIFDTLPLTLVFFAAFAAFTAGLVKGAVGFGMPMIMISFLSFFIAPDLSLAILIMPTLVTNLVQALRQGLGAAIAGIRKFRVFLIVGFVFLVSTAQIVTRVSDTTLFLFIGSAITFFAIFQLSGWLPDIKRTAKFDAGVGAFAGAVGGISGTWGPPTVAYLTAVNTPKAEQIRLQGVIYGLGSIALLAAHMRSGVITAQTLPLSAVMVIPAMVGVTIGYRWQTRISQAMFRKVTLIVLVFGGLNLLRRGFFG